MLTSQKGSSLVEVVLAITLFALLATAFWVAVREHDRLLKYANQYDELAMHMSRLAYQVREEAPHLGEDEALSETWKTDPLYAHWIDLFDLDVKEHENPISVTMTVQNQDDLGGGTASYTREARLFMVSAYVAAHVVETEEDETSVPRFTKKVLVVAP